MQGADSISCKLVIQEGDALWLSQHEDGHCGLPGGRVDEGETLHEAIRREAHEELGVEVRNIKLADAWLMLHDSKRDGQDCLILLYTASLASQPREGLSQDGERAVRVALKDVKNSGLRLPYLEALVRLGILPVKAGT